MKVHVYAAFGGEGVDEKGMFPQCARAAASPQGVTPFVTLGQRGVREGS